MRNIDHRLELGIGINFTDGSTDALHHQAAVAKGELHAVVHLIPVLVRLLGLHWQEGHVNLRCDTGEPAAVHHLRLLIIEAADLCSQVP